MARFARIVVRDFPHHVTARGNRREFFQNSDHDVYRGLLAEQTQKARVEILAYCLMPNHVHLIAIPREETGLARAVREAHRRYTNYINARAGFRGHLFQNRFGSVVMDDTHLLTALRYVSLNPVRARLVARAEDWPWSSVRAHLRSEDDELVVVGPALERVGDFRALLAADASDEAWFAALRRSETTGRPIVAGIS
ncbi:MAG TPA: transposase [Rhizomicrobium sp.]|jgi:putative transposase|nr:transposase [Rhizomicrobium sp.]